MSFRLGMGVEGCGDPQSGVIDPLRVATLPVGFLCWDTIIDALALPRGRARPPRFGDMRYS